MYKFCSTNEELHHAPNKPSFFLLGRVGTKGVEFLLISICSPQRPNGSPNIGTVVFTFGVNIFILGSLHNLKTFW